MNKLTAIIFLSIISLISVSNVLADIPPIPTGLSYNTDKTTYINWTWNNNTGNITDGFNVTVNTSIIQNNTLKYYNHTGLKHGITSSISIKAYNSTGSGNVSTSALTGSYTIPSFNECVNSGDFTGICNTISGIATAGLVITGLIFTGSNAGIVIDVIIIFAIVILFWDLSQGSNSYLRKKFK